MHRFLVRILFVISFGLGILFGILFTTSVHKCDMNNNNNNNKNKNDDNLYTKRPRNVNYDKWFKSNDLRREKVSLDDLRYGTKTYYTESEYLYDNVDIHCVILVHNKKNAIAANVTWAQNCNTVQFVNTVNENEKKKMIPTKKTKANSSWTLLCRTLYKLNNNHHWYLIVHDSTFTILENLRLMLGSLNSNDGYYIGHAVKFWGTTYNMGQAGYVLSNHTLSILQKRFANTSCVADITYMNQEDLYLGKVLSTYNIRPIDTRDSQGLTTFHLYNWQHEFFPGINYYKFSVYPVVCCSSQTVTFQAIEADKMHMYYYLLYQLQVFKSGNKGNRGAPTPIPQDEIWKTFLREHGHKDMNISTNEYYNIWVSLVHDPTAFAQEVLHHKYEYLD